MHNFLILNFYISPPTSIKVKAPELHSLGGFWCFKEIVWLVYILKHRKLIYRLWLVNNTVSLCH